MKRPTVASLKKVTPENLARLGAERLAELLAAAAETKPELKRRLRMELAAEQGAEHLIPEIDRRLQSLATSRSKVSWRQRPTFVRDVDALRSLIVRKLAGLDPAAARDRTWEFLGVARRVKARLSDRHGELAAVFEAAAADLAALLVEADPQDAGVALARAIMGDPHSWSLWAPTLLDRLPAAVARAALHRIADLPDLSGALLPLIRDLADAAGEVDAFRATFTAAALKDPSVAAEVARRLLAADRVEEAGRTLKDARQARVSPANGRAPGSQVDFDWETVWIDYLERSGSGGEAQAARWDSFERTLSADRAKAFTARLGDFDDVEAEQRAFAFAATHHDPSRGLGFLMEWPALAEAARMIEARSDELDVSPEQAEAWAAQLRGRYPKAAYRLLRSGAAVAFRRREYKTCDRLTKEAEALGVLLEETHARCRPLPMIRR